MYVRNLWKNYSLGIVLGALFLSSWLVQGIVGWQEFRAEQSSHQEAAHFFGASGYIWPFLEATFENWQSEFLQLFTFVVLTAYLVYRRSNESRDSQDEMRAAIDRIERQIELLSEDARAQRVG
jgi:hypothetical protein